MTESPKRQPGRPRSEASRAAILDAAYWQVVERGYANVTAEAIAKAAGAGKQTLYRWWSTKPAIVLEAFSVKARERVDRPLEAAIRNGDIAGYLKGLFVASKSLNPALRCLIGEAQTDPQLLGELRAWIFEPRAATLNLMLAPRVPDSAARETLVAAIDGAIWRRLLLGEALDDRFALALAGLAPPALRIALLA
jgi:AcrR family transcriptional regulator